MRLFERWLRRADDRAFFVAPGAESYPLASVESKALRGKKGGRGPVAAAPAIENAFYRGDREIVR